MQRSTNLGMSLGQLLSGAFNKDGYQQGQLSGMKQNQIQADIDYKNVAMDKARVEAAQKQQEIDNSSDDGLSKSLIAGVQNGINGDNAANDFKSYLNGTYHPREQQGPGMQPNSYVAPPAYVSQFPELQKKFSALKQMLAVGDKNIGNISKSIQGDQRNAITANAGAMTPQEVADTASKVSLFESNPNPVEVQKAAQISSIAQGLGTPEMIDALTLASGKGLFNNSANGTFNMNTGVETLNDLGASGINKNNSVTDLNNAKVDQTNTAIDLNKSNIDLVKARTINENNKAVTTAPTVAPNGQPYSTKPLPTPALKMQQEELETIGTVSGTNADLAAINKQIKDGALHLGTFTNYLSGAKNYIGLSDESSQNFATLQATLEKARNSSLLLNKGVQTDGDAQRAWNELLKNINDPNVVQKRLTEIQLLNDRAVKIRKAKISNLRKNYNAPPMDYSEFDAPNTSIQNGSNGNQFPDYVEIRKTKDGRTLGKTADGRIVEIQ